MDKIAPQLMIVFDNKYEWQFLLVGWVVGIVVVVGTGSRD